MLIPIGWEICIVDWNLKENEVNYVDRTSPVLFKSLSDTIHLITVYQTFSLDKMCVILLLATTAAIIVATIVATTTIDTTTHDYNYPANNFPFPSPYQ